MIRTGVSIAILTFVYGASALAQTDAGAEDEFPREGSSYETEPGPAPEPMPEAAPAPTPTPSPAPTPSETAAADTSSTSTSTSTTGPAGPAAEAAAEDDDDGERSRHFWIDIAAGYSWINLVALDQSNFTPDPKTVRSSGPTIEGGLGVSFSIVRIGVAGAYARYASFDVATAELDLTLEIPLPLVQPYIEVGFGYAWIRNVDEMNGSGMNDIVPIRGIAADLGLGLDIHISDLIQFGVNVDASVLNLQRQRVTDLGTVTNVDFTKEGSAVGLQIHGMGRLTFQF